MMYAVLYRSLLAFVTGFGIALLLSIPVRKLLLSLYRDRTGDNRGKAADKSFVPRMGGIVIIAAMLVSSLIWARESYRFLLAALLTAGLFGGLGFADDFIGILKKNDAGLPFWQRLIAELTLSIGAGILLYFVGGGSLWGQKLPIGWLYIPVASLLIWGAVNAVRRTDAPAGLGASVSGIGLGAMTLLLCMAVVCAPIGAQADGLLDLSALSVFAASAAGGCLGFLILGAYPARLALGSTGAYALGAGLAAVSLLSGTPLLLPLFGIIPVLFGGSAAADAVSTQFFGKRLDADTPVFGSTIGQQPERVLSLSHILTVISCAVALIIYWFFK